MMPPSDTSADRFGHPVRPGRRRAGSPRPRREGVRVTPLPFLHGRGALLLSIFLLFAGGFSFSLGLVLAQDGVQALLFGLAIMSIVIVVLPVLIDRRYFIFEPLSFVIFSVLFGLCLKTFYIVLGYGWNDVVTDKLMDDLPIDGLVYGTTVLILGLVTFAVGYSVSRKRTTSFQFLRRYGFAQGRMLVVSVIIIALSLMFFALLVSSVNFTFGSFADLSQKRFQGNGVNSGERLSSLPYYYYRLSLLAKAPMYVLFYYVMRYEQRWSSPAGVLFFVALAINCVVPFFISNKAGIFLPVADLTIIAYVIRGKLNVTRIVLLTTAAVFVVSLIAAFRGGEAVADYSFFDKVFGGRYFIGLTKSAHIINSVPAYIDYFYGKTLVGWMNLFLPEAWAFDNSVFAGLGFFLGYHVFGYVATGVPPGIVPELYLNFGLFGVIIGMFVVGFGLKWVHHALYAHVDRCAGLIVYAIVVVRLPTFLFNNGFSVAFMKTLADVLIVAVMLVLIRSRARGALR